MPKMFRLFSTPPPTNQPFPVKPSVWKPDGRAVTGLSKVVPDQFEPV